MKGTKWTLLGAVFLSACATVDSEPAAFPPLKEYSREQQAQAADELDALPDGSILPVFMGDYAKLRAQVRAFLAETD